MSTTSVPTCPACDRPYNGDDGCRANPYPHAHRYGAEPFFAELGLEPLPRCGDCGTPTGEPHHARCLQAHCATCQDQAVACGHAERASDTGIRRRGGA